jgi:hypothetical protein
MSHAHTDQHALLQRARAAAKELHRASEQLVEFAERLSADLGPDDMLEYDTLVARETAALSQRVEAFEALGLGVPSIDGDENS